MGAAQDDYGYGYTDIMGYMEYPQPELWITCLTVILTMT